MNVQEGNSDGSKPPIRWRHYPKYKPSGVEWLGEVPEGWDIDKIKFSTYVKGRIGWQGLRSDEFIETGPYLVTGTDFNQGSIIWDSCYHISEVRYNEDPYIHLRENDLLITKDGSIGKTAIVKHLPGKASLNSGIFLTRSIDKTYITNFMYYILNSNVFSSFIDYNKAGSTISHLYQNIFVEFSYPLPPLPEQHAIAAFLDRETARIDALIEKKKRQIELLQEKRAALISHAVTKGLDPNAKMKDSGIEWLGMIPEGWEVKKLKNFCDIVGRIGFRGYTTEDQVPEGEGALALGATQINERGEVNCVNSVFISWEKYYESPEIFANVNDLLIVQRGSTCGKVGLVSKDYGPTTINPSVVLVKRIKISSKYLFFWLSSQLIQGFFASLKTSTAIPMLSQNQIENSLFVCPSESEMELIINHVANKIQEFDLLKNRIDQSILLLREYRSTLISAAVIGKIDIRQEILT